ncbi:hypothetical protein CI1B_04900 [Bradyrhizobium ivorense]|uniref:Uncharacterized protein n=1 Tax=Bradyrhizobium ivorense TaxID=2511166 RepID=A0A508STR7_9BRAD|nr:hypothetical protein [Bradyrhizobium ivorense]MCC8942781.1 hypothetical protein [Bradyrhizobium ivorense]VIO65390.1 hypothetical protein CI1B_04900 [Bradyrhizobium ivorense]VIO67380.1 hypothetical protein CI41S_07460 [Bradyrhizobium ivorense]
MLRRLLNAFWILLAIIFLIEAWLWDHLEPIVERIVAALPLRAMKHWVAERVHSLSPATTLFIFVIPAISLFPLKLIGLWLLANNYWMSAVSLILFAKFVGMGLTAFLFDVTRPKLLQMRWFQRLYDFVIALRAKATALVEPVKQRALEALRGDGDGWTARTLRSIARFRKSVHQAR